MLENLESLSTWAILGIGLLFGLKHATEVDHVVAVSTIVSQHKDVFRSALGAGGHALVSLVVLRVAIPQSRVAGVWCSVIIGLGISAGERCAKSKVHVHQHSHDGLSHVHIHFREKRSMSGCTGTHALSRLGWKPVLIGTCGLAGSGALTLLVLTQISSSWVGFLYLAIFGIGSMVGMLLMSGLIGFPFALTSRQLTSAHHRLQTLAALLSICFGAWYAYETSAVMF
jgi:hypothetical protein